MTLLSDMTHRTKPARLVGACPDADRHVTAMHNRILPSVPPVSFVFISSMKSKMPRFTTGGQKQETVHVMSRKCSLIAVALIVFKKMKMCTIHTGGGDGLPTEGTCDSGICPMNHSGTPLPHTMTGHARLTARVTAWHQGHGASSTRIVQLPADRTLHTTGRKSPTSAQLSKREGPS